MAKIIDTQKIIDSLESLPVSDLKSIKEKCEEILNERKKEAEQTLNEINGKS
jgi:ElaB/YqjD/DUF883 family membrane-anchored ribosome-binding protein